MLVAEIDGRIAGTVIAAWDGWRGTIYRMAVVEDHKRKGVGRALADAAVRRLRELGSARINAYVVKEDAHAMSFWPAVGFEMDTTTQRFKKTL